MIIIAHRGASGYLPEHSLEAKALAYGLGSSYIEQDLVLSKDNHAIVCHDLYLNNITNIAHIFPDKKRIDGKYYIIDFTLEELQKLQLSERFYEKNGQKYAKYADRFPIFTSNFRIHTLEEEIELIKGLNKSMNKNIGIYPEIKYPDFHLKEGKDISKIILKILQQYNYKTKKDKIYLQSFDQKELQRIKKDLFKEMNIELKLIQLIGKNEWEEGLIDRDGQKYQENINYDTLLTKEGVKQISDYADGVGLHFSMIIDDQSTKNNIIYKNILNLVRKNNLKSHIYTIRSDKGQIPHYAQDYNNFINILQRCGIDGIFSDFPDMGNLTTN